ncbi:MAG TPA: asparagine synthase (glutamine-hydrolyzing) [Bacteroidales bacterium]|nr:asparagine synthase (glutamine-hydrolyzing) [Bacteroidales bacterium]
MCGILGGINIENERLLKALPLLKHRGPDEKGVFFFKNIGLLHTRLCIQDIKSGHQPFKYEDLVLIYNGEIYNHLELRVKYNLVCKTKSDAETLIMLYHKLGFEVLHELDGMFAFAIYDMRTRTISLARDRAGKKPVYYYCRDGKFAFGSELNALRHLDSFEIDYKNIYQYLRYSCTAGSTPYKDICELEAGTWASIDINSLELRLERWWSIFDFYQKQESVKFNDALLELNNLLNKSVSSRLFSSDLEVGAFLSGGIDSGIITAIASNHISKLKTFTIGFEGMYDESELAEIVSRRYDTEHIQIGITFGDLSNDIEQILSNYGEPFGDSSAIPSFLISREAKKYISVVLNGDGADELFAGYRRYVPFAHFDLFKTGNTTRTLAGVIASFLPFPRNKQSKYNYIYRLLELAGKVPLMSYLSSTVDTFEGYENMLNNDSHPFDVMKTFIEEINNSGLSGLQKIMCIDFQFLLPNDLLVKMDIATMANSLEGRSPFLSKEILEYAPLLDDSYKIRGLNTKFILRELAKKYLPKVITSQPKRGFEVPLKKWIETDLRELVFDYLSGNTLSQEFVNKNFIMNLLENRASVAPEKRAKMLWYMMALEIWYRKCYLK